MKRVVTVYSLNSQNGTLRLWHHIKSCIPYEHSIIRLSLCTLIQCVASICFTLPLHTVSYCIYHKQVSHLMTLADLACVYMMCLEISGRPIKLKIFSYIYICIKYIIYLANIFPNKIASVHGRKCGKRELLHVYTCIYHPLDEGNTST